MSARSAVDAFVERAGSDDDAALFTSVGDQGRLRDIADRIDRRPAHEVPLRGTVFAVKDNIDVADLPTTAACPAFSYDPTRSAFAVHLLVAAGAVPVAKTNMDQFATGLVGTRSPYGVPRNPYDPAHVPGGSSSGSAVAVARVLVDFSLGTDTAGSGRVPAAFCGIIGVRPTLGAVSMTGVVPAVRTCDTVSVFARDLDLARLALSTMTIRDPDDSYARDPEPRPAVPMRDLRVAVLSSATLGALGCDQVTIGAYESTVAQLATGTHSLAVVDIDELFRVGDVLYGGPWLAERTAAVGAFVEDHRADCDPVVAEIILGGRRFDAVAAHRAGYGRADAIGALRRFWRGHDVLVTPTVPHGASIGDVAADPIGVNAALGRFTTFANLLDMAAITVPITSTTYPSGMPGSVTVYGPAWSEPTLFGVADRLLGRREQPMDVPSPGCVDLVVAGAHLRGQPLAHQLVGLGARWRETTRTAASYRLHALAGSEPPKPGLVHDESGSSIEVDVWELSEAALGRFIQMVPPPLALGTVELLDGRRSVGFVCEPRALDGALDITHLGGWRSFVG